MTIRTSSVKKKKEKKNRGRIVVCSQWDYPVRHLCMAANAVL